MARKKAHQLSKKQKRQIRIQQIIFIVIGIIVIASMLIAYVY